MLINLVDIMKLAEEKQYGLAAINTPNLECIYAVLDNAEKYNVPVVIMHAECHNPEKGNALKEKCDKACVGCEACVKSCNFGALTMENGVPKFDYEKCVGCMACADACPTGALTAQYELRKEAYIDPDKCVGCTLCVKQCKFDAIEGALKQKHKVLGACTGCGACAAKCPRKAITMRDRRAPRNKMDKVKKAPVAPAAKPAAPVAKPAAPAAEQK